MREGVTTQETCVIHTERGPWPGCHVDGSTRRRPEAPSGSHYLSDLRYVGGTLPLSPVQLRLQVLLVSSQLRSTTTTTTGAGDDDGDVKTNSAEKPAS